MQEKVRGLTDPRGNLKENGDTTWAEVGDLGEGQEKQNGGIKIVQQESEKYWGI